ncbi:MAG TPA: TRAFs-binding domain-containing protein, partial [Gemmatimonadaceae bacterium]|nr:TRAFs-binding domain-containing protein [Gemmatimonadaceae bacterium]
KTDVFRERAEYSAMRKAELEAARRAGRQGGGVETLRAIEGSLGPLHAVEAGVVVDLFLSYRAVSAWDEMIRLAGAMDQALGETVLVREQLALALNRVGRRDEAERVITSLIERRGPSSESCGILGRVYKDEWVEASAKGESFRARGFLQQAIDAYTSGFEADPRDAYPGVNAVTLMELRDPPDPRRLELVPVVRYAVKRRMASGTPDYWDHATLVELAVLARDEAAAGDALSAALALVAEGWQAETTARNLRLINEARDRRGEGAPWALVIQRELERAAAER